METLRHSNVVPNYSSRHWLYIVPLCAAIAAPLLRAQEVEGPIWPPAVYGQWEGPYDLNSFMDEPGDPTVGPLGEIAHACLLATGIYQGQVLFWNWPNPFPAAPGQYLPRSFVWNPNDTRSSINSVRIDIPSALGASEDIFCAGHTFLSNGDLLAVGGRDFTGPPATGINLAFAFRPNANPVAWEKLQGIGMQRERYYPATVTKHTGDVTIVGHTGGPVYSPRTEQTRDEYNATSQQFAPLRQNLDFLLPSPCDETGHVSLYDYAKVFLLSTNWLIWVDGERRTPPDVHTSWYLDLDPAAPPDCPASVEPHRWFRGVDTSHLPEHAGGNAVHLITWDTGLPGETTGEVIYNIGGTEHGADDNANCLGPVSNLVERLPNPAVGATWQDAAIPDLNKSRYTSNAVVLLDGSILVVGGIGRTPEPENICVARLRPERYEPDEVFGTGADAQWRSLAPQIDPRAYHSVAGLLPDGRVFSAGGQSFNSMPNKHSVEMFKPPYFFSTPRPEIVVLPPGTLQYAGFDNITVELRSQFYISRFALLRNASVTHHFDFNQRYVELDFTFVSETSGPPHEVIYKVDWPASAPVAPPGYYLLTAVDMNGVPSPAGVVQLQ